MATAGCFSDCRFIDMIKMTEEAGVLVLADMDFIIICTYEKDGENPELLIYKKR